MPRYEHELPYWDDDESVDPEIFFKLLVEWYADRDLTDGECKEGVALLLEAFGIAELPRVTGAIVSRVRGQGPTEPKLTVAKASRDAGTMTQDDFEKFSDKQRLSARWKNLAACRGALLNWIQKYCPEFTQRRTKGRIIMEKLDDWMKRIFALK